ncbi:MAG: zinc ribbon domain-containing protein [Coprobacillus sp.]
MYCKQCGKEIEEAKFCPYCGAAQEVQATQENQGYQPINEQPYQQSYQTAQGDESSIGFAFLSFFIPIVGIVLYIVWNKEYPKKAKSCLKGFIVSIVFYFVVICCLVSASMWAVNQYDSDSYYDPVYFDAIVETIPYE